MKRLRLWLARLLVLLFATLVSLKVGDLAVGWLRNTQERHLLRLPISAHQRHRSTEFDYIFTGNSLGLRGPERPLAKPTGTQRVAVIGDSFVAGYGVADEDVFTARLESLLTTARGSPVEVINVGRNGTSTVRELDLYTLIGRRFNPDIVVLAYFLGNDLREVVEEHDAQELRHWHPQGVVRRAAYGLCPNLYLELALLKMSALARESSQPRTEDEVLAALRRECEQNGTDYTSAAAAFRRLPGEVKRGLEQRLLRDHQILAACFDPDRLRRALNPDDAYFERAWPRTERHLELLRQAITADHAQFVVLILPDAVQVDDAAHQFATQIGTKVRTEWLTGPCRTGKAVAEWCHRAGVPCLDLTDELRRSPEPLYYRQDGHFNPAGHERTAELLAEFLRERRT